MTGFPLQDPVDPYPKAIVDGKQKGSWIGVKSFFLSQPKTEIVYYFVTPGTLTLTLELGTAMLDEDLMGGSLKDLNASLLEYGKKYFADFTNGFEENDR
jgi:hypothetical protein